MSFDDEHTPGPSINFNFDAVEGEDLAEQLADAHEEIETLKRRIALERRQAFAFFFDCIIGPNATATHRRAHLLRFVWKLSPFRRQRELAEVLKITEGRLSQLLKIFSLELPKLAAAKRIGQCPKN